MDGVKKELYLSINQVENGFLVTDKAYTVRNASGFVEGRSYVTTSAPDLGRLIEKLAKNHPIQKYGKEEIDGCQK